MRAKLGLYHLDTLRSMNILAILYRAVGRIQDAIKLNEETLELMRAKLGPYHRDTLLSMYDLGISSPTPAATGRRSSSTKKRSGCEKPSSAPTTPTRCWA